MSDTDHFVPENLTSEQTKSVMSPSVKYRLEIRYYRTKAGCWSYSRGTVYRVLDNVEICDIKRNYSSFHHSFVIRPNGTEYLITGRSYMSQTIVDLSTGQIYEPPGDQYDAHAFCWASAKLSPDGNTLMVHGCHWACPYEIRFYDFTDPAKGWPQIRVLDNDDEELLLDDDQHKEPTFNSDGSITHYETRKVFIPLNKTDDEFEIEELRQHSSDAAYEDKVNWKVEDCVRTTLVRRGDHSKSCPNGFRKTRKSGDRKQEANLKHEAMLAKFKAEDPLYLEYKRLIPTMPTAANYESYGWVHASWHPTYQNKTEIRWCRRIVESKDPKITVDLQWAVETGPIKLVVYRDGKHSEDLWFDHTVREMTNAFEYAKKISET